MLKDLLEQKKCFKLVCGAGNEDVDEVEKLVTIYSLAGANFFDVCAKPEVVDAAKRGLKNSGITNERYLCVSVGIEGDPHITKAEIDYNKCINCGACRNICPHDAINYKDIISINKKRCIGCSQCQNVCPTQSINMKSSIQEYDFFLPEIIKKDIDCIEFHAITDDENDVLSKWTQLNALYDGFLCISLDRSLLGDIKLKKRVSAMLEKRKPYTTIIQADGVAMSGNDDEFGTTLQAVATAQLFQNAKIPAYIMMSGGTNSKSVELANLCGVFPHCVAIGSYARKIVKEYLNVHNLLEDKDLLNKATLIAKRLVDITIGN